MHFHTIPQEPGYTPAFCLEHAPEEEPMFECWADFAWHRCTICEDAAFCQTCTARQEERALVGVETFSLILHDPEGSLTWDIDQAWRLVNASPRAPRIIAATVGDGYVVQTGEVDPDHFDHIPEATRTTPGLAVVLDNMLPDGTRQVLIVQIDGSHRSALAERQGRPRLVYLLTEEEQAACVLLYARNGQVMPLPQIPGPAPTL